MVGQLNVDEQFLLFLNLSGTFYIYYIILFIISFNSYIIHLFYIPLSAVIGRKLKLCCILSCSHHLKCLSIAQSL